MSEAKYKITSEIDEVLDDYARDIGKKIAKKRFGTNLQNFGAVNGHVTPEAEKKWNELTKTLGERSETYKNTVVNWQSGRYQGSPLQSEKQLGKDSPLKTIPGKQSKSIQRVDTKRVLDSEARHETTPRVNKVTDGEAIGLGKKNAFAQPNTVLQGYSALSRIASELKKQWDLLTKTLSNNGNTYKNKKARRQPAKAIQGKPSKFSQSTSPVKVHEQHADLSQEPVYKAIPKVQALSSGYNVAPRVQKILDDYAKEIGTQIATRQFGAASKEVNTGSSQSTPEQKKLRDDYTKSLGESSDIYRNTKQAIVGSRFLRSQLNAAVDGGLVSAIRYDPRHRLESTGVEFNDKDKSIVINKVSDSKVLAYKLGFSVSMAVQNVKVKEHNQQFYSDAMKVLTRQSAGATRDYTSVIAARLKSQARTVATAEIEGFNASFSYNRDDAVYRTLSTALARNVSKPAARETGYGLKSHASFREKTISGLVGQVVSLENKARDASSITKDIIFGSSQLGTYSSDAAVVINTKQLGIQTEKLINLQSDQHSGAQFQFEDRSSKNAPVKVVLSKSSTHGQSISKAEQPGQRAVLPIFLPQMIRQHKLSRR
jgi:hypothetical protein